MLVPSARDPFRDVIPMYPAFVTDERLLTLIHLLKFGRRERVAPWLARAMAAALPARLTDAWPAGTALVIPVPMDRASRAQRGFNQAERIARELSLRWSLPLSCALVKGRRTKPQSALGREERLVNLDGAFGADVDVVGGTRVILVDDLVTTGATVRACARALRAAGAVEVRVVCAGYRDEAPAYSARFSNLDKDFQSE
jgi:ComF family protein